MPRGIVTETRRDKLSSQVKQLIRKTEKHAKGIQVETCPAPECNLSTKNVKRFLSETKNGSPVFNGKPGQKRPKHVNERN